MIITILAFFLILSILVLIHELGHFLTAKKFGVKVEEFGFGFPPRIFGIRRGETLYSINLLPFGGFVKLFGEDEAGAGSVQVKGPKKDIPAGDLNRAFYTRSALQRFIMVVAGVVMNFLLAVILISFLFATQGVALPTDKIRISEVLKSSPAQKAGLISGDVIRSIDGKRLTDTDAFIAFTKSKLGQEVAIVIERNGKTQEVKVTPRKDYPKGEGPMGVSISSIEIKKYPWYIAPVYGTWEAMKYSYLIGKGLFDTVANLILHGQKPQGVAGPVGVAQLTGQAVSYGFYATLWFMALLSLNLAVLNVLPIPALDGGRLFFIIIEIVTRKKISPKYEAYAHAAGLAILLSLIIIVTVFDVVRLVQGKNILQP